MKRMSGLTLPELLFGMIIMIIVIGFAWPGMDSLLVRQSLISKANQLAGLIRSARARAVASEPVLICSRRERCASFKEPAGALLLVRDLDDNRLLGNADEVETGIELPDGMTVLWRSFRAKPWLRINRRGTAWYQNGHFLLCYREKGYKVVVNYQGLPRTERVADDECRE